MKVEAFFDEGRTFTLTYVVYDENTKDAVVLDPVLDLDTIPWKTSTESLDKVESFIKDNNLKVHWIMDTHVHADHLSGAAELKKRLGAPFAIGEHIQVVQEIFSDAFHLENFACDGSQFDRLLKDGDEVEAGSLKFEVMHTPGHTPACLTFKIEDAIFTGDVLFAPPVGVARCDFPRGSAKDLYRSITTRLYTLPDDTRVFVGHDYPSGRELQYMTTIGESKAKNVDLPGDLGEAEFVKKISERDATLSAPRLLFPSLQVNIRAGELPEAEANNTSYLKIPLNFL